MSEEEVVDIQKNLKHISGIALVVSTSIQNNLALIIS